MNLFSQILDYISIGYFQANPFRQQTLKTFAKGRATFYALIVPINSPLKPILQKASNTLLEAGTMDYLVKVWEGKNSFISVPFFIFQFF